jgi:hypothetical protein
VMAATWPPQCGWEGPRCNARFPLSRGT